MKVAVGIFVAIFFFAIFGATYLLLDAKGFFQKRYSYYFISDSASSFTIGMPVKFSGFAIGSIDKIELLDDGHVKTIFSITQKNRKWINKYTYLLLKKPLLGSPHIEVLASSGNGFLKPGSKLPIIITDDINDLVTKFEPVVDKLLNIIKNIETITNSLVSTDSPLNKTLANLETFSSKLANDDSLMTTITGDKTSAKKITSALENIDKILKDVSATTTTLHDDLIKPTSITIKELHAILVDVHTKLKMLQPLVKSLGESDKSVTQLQQSIQSTIDKTDQLMGKIDSILVDTDKKEVELP